MATMEEHHRNIADLQFVDSSVKEPARTSKGRYLEVLAGGEKAAGFRVSDSKLSQPKPTPSFTQQFWKQKEPKQVKKRRRVCTQGLTREHKRGEGCF